MPVASCIPFPFSALCDDVLTMLVCATRWLSMHLYTLVHMFMHESCLLVSHPYFNKMKLWIFDPNLHLSLANTTFCLLPCLFAFQFACLSCCLSCLLPHAMLALLVCLSALYPLRIIYTSLSFHCLSASFLSLPSHIHIRSKDTQSQGTISQVQAKGARMRACGYKPSGWFSRFRGLASPIWLRTLLNPLSSSLLSHLDGLYQV